MSSAGRKQALRCILSDAIIELCRREAFYITELRIEGTICVVSDRSSALIIQITEQVGEKTSDAEITDNRQTPQSVYTVADDVVPVDDMRDGHGMGDDLEKDDFASEEAQIHQMVIKAGLVERMEGKYNCPFCPKRYRFKHSLKDHINKHTGNRPHQCKHCSLRFIHLSSLCAHVRRRHSQVRVANFRCDICQDVFATEQFLKQHHTWKHKEGRTKASIRGPGKDQHDPAIPGSSAPPGNNESIIRWSDLSASQDLQQLFWDSGLKSSGRGGMGGGPNLEGSGNNNNNNSGNNNNAQDEMDDQNMCFQQQIKLEPGGNSGGSSGGSRPHHALQKGILGAGGTSSLSPTFHFQQQQQHNFNRQSSAFGFPFGTSTPTSFGSFGFPPGHGSNAAWAGSMMSPTGAGGAGSGGVGADGSFLRRSGNGKFQCPHCDKSYNFKHTLKEHINKHLGRRPNVCKHCGDSFIHLASLCAHIKRAHDEHMPTDFVCRICNEKLMNYQSLKQHYTWRHREARMLIEANAQTLAAAGLTPITNSSPGDMERNGSSGQLGNSSAAAAHLWQQQLMSPSQQPQQQQQSQQQAAPPEHSTTPVPQPQQVVVDSHGIPQQQQQQQQQQLLLSNSKDEFTNTSGSSSSGTSNGGIVKNAALKELDFLQGFESFAQSIGVNMGLDSHHLHHHHHHIPTHHHQHGHHHHQQQPPQPPPHHHHSNQKDGLGPSMLLKDHHHDPRSPSTRY